MLVFLILISDACKRKAGTGSAEGMISFSITYDQSRVGGYSTAILPKEMIMEFNGNKVMNTIKGGLGFFRLVHVSDMRYSQHTTWLKFIDKRYIYEGDKRESPCCFSILDGMQLEFTDNTKVIAGLNCLNAIASFPDNGIEAFDIWYTKELDIDNPNSNTPFMDIPGVMLEFNTLMGNANMHMMATTYEAQPIPQKKFLAPQNYRPVSKAEMESILNALMN